MKITGKTKRCGVIGNPIEYNLLPEIFNAWFKKYDIDAVYLPFHVLCDINKTVAAIHYTHNVIGFNLAMQHKSEVKLCDHVFGARHLEDVNVAVRNEVSGRFHLHNTDGQGFINAIKKKYPDFKHKGLDIWIVGKGAVAQSIKEALETQGLKPNFYDSRAAARSPYNTSLRMLINATPLGMVGYPPFNINLEHLPKNTLICDVVTSPIETELIKAAKARGNPYITGYDMLYEVARLSFELWFGFLPDRIE